MGYMYYAATTVRTGKKMYMRNNVYEHMIEGTYFYHTPMFRNLIAKGLHDGSIALALFDFIYLG